MVHLKNKKNYFMLTFSRPYCLWMSHKPLIRIVIHMKKLEESSFCEQKTVDVSPPAGLRSTQ